MKTLTLFYPAKPFVQTQAWGISNPSYAKFGFDHHNGVDFMIGSPKYVYAPVKFRVEDAGYNESAGNYVRGITTEKWRVGDADCYVGLMFMHNERLLCKTGYVLEVGDRMSVPDNTGFSTGPHIHMSTYRLKRPQNAQNNRLDTDWHTNYTFDPFPYWTGTYAQDQKLQPAEEPKIGYVFTRDLHATMQGEDVKQLQKYLNSKGYHVSTAGPGSAGNETDYFGDMTIRALIAFQKAKKISPAIGYFGAVTRKYIANNL